MQENKWLLQEIDKEKLSVLKKELNLPEIIIKILIGRGFSDVESIKKYCTSTEDIFILADLIKAFHPDLLPDYQPVYYKLLP